MDENTVTEIKFKRVYRVVIGKKGSNAIEFNSDSNSKANQYPLQIEFEINKNTKKEPNEAKLKIYNLSNSTIQKINQPDTLVFLYAGYEYEGEALLIACGAIYDALTIEKDSQNNKVTEITFLDGLIEYRDSVISVGYQAGVRSDNIINAVAVKMGLKLMMPSDIEHRVYNSGLSYYGSARELLSRVCFDAGLSWSIQNQTLQVVKIGGTTNRRVVSLDAYSGLIGYPERNRQGAKTRKAPLESGTDKKIYKITSESAKERNGWTINSLLLPTLNPADIIYIDSEAADETGKQLKGYYKVSELNHRGSFYGGDWQTEIIIHDDQLLGD